jgi:AmmeMemoRadiSam system protein A
MLNPSQRSRLLTIAREAIAAVHQGRRLDVDPASFDEQLRRPAGAFVSLHTQGGDLRGCIGSIHPVAPLCLAVPASAVNAAFRDPRFHPVGPEELEHLHIEISVMGPIEIVRAIEDIVVGRDGLIVTRGQSAGLLLPQVATDYGWDLEAFLSHTCLKAGLAPEAWRLPDCRIERFSAEVFSE